MARRHSDWPPASGGWGVRVLGFEWAVVAWIEADYAAALARGDSPSLSFVYAMRQAPFLLVGLPLLLVGLLSILRPWTAGRPWLAWLAAGGAVAWFALAVGHGVPLPE